MLEGEIVECSQVLNPKRAQVFQLVDCKSIRAWSGGILAAVDGRPYLSGGEWCQVPVQLMLSADASQESP